MISELKAFISNLNFKEGNKLTITLGHLLYGNSNASTQSTTIFNAKLEPTFIIISKISEILGIIPRKYQRTSYYINDMIYNVVNINNGNQEITSLRKKIIQWKIIENEKLNQNGISYLFKYLNENPVNNGIIEFSNVNHQSQNLWIISWLCCDGDCDLEIEFHKETMIFQIHLKLEEEIKMPPIKEEAIFKVLLDLMDLFSTLQLKSN